MNRLILKIFLELVFVIIIFLEGTLFWQYFKRNWRIGRILNNEAYLRGFISPLLFREFKLPNDIKIDSDNVGLSVLAFIKADLETQRRLNRVAFIFLLIVFLGSYFFLGIILLLVNIFLFLLTWFSPQANAQDNRVGFDRINTHSMRIKTNPLEYVQVLAYLLHLWRSENPSDCDQFIDQAWSLKILYKVIKDKFG